METRRLHLTDDLDDDPFSFHISREESFELPAPCYGEQVVYEVWCTKRSKWLRQWRRRWLVLTSTRIAFFRSDRGYTTGERPTETFELRPLRVGGVKLLDDREIRHAGLAASVPRGVVVSLDTASREVLLDMIGSRAAQELVTAVVNARCALHCQMVPEYGRRGCVHAFEPRGVVAFRERYVLGEEIGRGAFGVVYGARSLQSGRAVAVKRVQLSHVRQRERVREEVHIMRAVRHPHVVALLDFHETWSDAHMVMELLPGGDLYTQVVGRYWSGTACEGYSERDVREILRMALSGLEALHLHRVCHRDLKPENVLLLDRRGGLLDLRICDFGAAVRLAPNELCGGEQAGSPGYMAPEVLCAEPYGLPVDLWSLGIILYTLLCGRPPYDGREPLREAADIKAGRWSFAGPNWAEVSDEAKDVVRRLLARRRAATMPHDPGTPPQGHRTRATCRTVVLSASPALVY